MTIEWAIPRTRGPYTKATKSGISIVLLAKGRASLYPQISIGIRADAMQAMRWMIGDRAVLGFDPLTGEYIIARSPSGYKLTPRNTKLKAHGKSLAATLKISLPDFIRTSDLPAHIPLSECTQDGTYLRFRLKGGDA